MALSPHDDWKCRSVKSEKKTPVSPIFADRHEWSGIFFPFTRGRTKIVKGLVHHWNQQCKRDFVHPFFDECCLIYDSPARTNTIFIPVDIFAILEFDPHGKKSFLLFDLTIPDCSLEISSPPIHNLYLDKLTYDCLNWSSFICFVQL